MKEITISSAHALMAVFVMGVLSCLVVILGWHIASVKPKLNLDEILGCLPGTHAQVSLSTVGERMDDIVARCVKDK